MERDLRTFFWFMVGIVLVHIIIFSFTKLTTDQKIHVHINHVQTLDEVNLTFDLIAIPLYSPVNFSENNIRKTLKNLVFLMEYEELDLRRVENFLERCYLIEIIDMQVEG